MVSSACRPNASRVSDPLKSGILDPNSPVVVQHVKIMADAFMSRHEFSSEKQETSACRLLVHIWCGGFAGSAHVTNPSLCLDGFKRSFTKFTQVELVYAVMPAPRPAGSSYPRRLLFPSTAAEFPSLDLTGKLVPWTAGQIRLAVMQHMCEKQELQRHSTRPF